MMFRIIFISLTMIAVFGFKLANSEASAHPGAQVSCAISDFEKDWQELLALEKSLDAGQEVRFLEKLAFMSHAYTGSGKELYHDSLGSKLVFYADRAMKVFDSGSDEYLMLMTGLHNIFLFPLGTQENASLVARCGSVIKKLSGIVGKAQNKRNRLEFCTMLYSVYNAEQDYNSALDFVIMKQNLIDRNSNSLEYYYTMTQLCGLYADMFRTGKLKDVYARYMDTETNELYKSNLTLFLVGKCPDQVPATDLEKAIMLSLTSNEAMAEWEYACNLLAAANRVDILQEMEAILLKNEVEPVQLHSFYLAAASASSGNWHNAIEMTEKAIKLATEKKLGKRNFNFTSNDTVSHYFILATYYEKTGESFDKQMDAYKKGLADIELNFGKLNETYIDALYFIGNMYANHLMDFDKHLEYVFQALQLTCELYGKDSEQYMESAISYIGSNNLGSRFERSIEMGNALMADCAKLHPGLVAKLYNQLGISHSELGDYNKAIACYDKAILNASGYSVDDILSFKLNKLNALTNLYNWEDAKRLASDVKKTLRSSKLGQSSFFYAYTKLAGMYGQFGMRDKAYELYVLAESNMDAVSFGNRIFFYLNMSQDAPDNYVRKNCLDKAWKTYQDAGLKDDYLLADLYRAFGDYYGDALDYYKALEYYQKGLKIYESREGFDYSVLTLLNNMAGAIEELGYPDESARLNERVLNVRREALGDTHPMSLLSLQNLLYDYINLKQFESADSLYAEYGKIAKGLNDKKARVLYQYAGADLAVAKNDFDRAARIYESCWKNFKEEGSLDYFGHTLMGKMVRLYALSDSEKFKDWSTRYYHESKKEILNSFIGLNEAERKNWVDKVEDLSAGMIRYGHIGDMKLAAESSLFFKGLLYRTGTVIESLAKENPAAQELYLQIKEQRNLLNALENTGDYTRVDALRNEIGELERKLNNDHIKFKEFRRNLDVDWKSFKNSLGDRAVIDFVSYGDSTDVRYGAFVYSRKTEEPVYRELFLESELTRLLQRNADNLYQSDDLYVMVWQKLLPDITGYVDVFFSPVGLLNKIAIENHTKMIGLQNGNQLRLHRVPVLTDLQTTEDVPLKRVVAFGDIDYSGQLKENFYAATNLRGGYWGPLPGTAGELNVIERCFAGNQDAKVSVYSKDSATERQFMALDGEDVNLFHFATHGFYYADLNKADRPHVLQRMSRLYTSFSGLLMSGANKGWNSAELASNLDDGILTYQEISNCHFNELGVVVLSACDTGLGNVDYDGVWGLQRAFKIAGARNLVVSLCPIDDTAAELFMKHFYENLSSGESVYRAFSMARMVMMKAYPGDSTLWSSFILVE